MASEMGKIDNEFLIEYFKDRGLDNISSAELDRVKKIQECNMTQVCCKTSPTLTYGEYHSQLESVSIGNRATGYFIMF